MLEPAGSDAGSPQEPGEHQPPEQDHPGAPMAFLDLQAGGQDHPKSPLDILKLQAGGHGPPNSPLDILSLQVGGQGHPRAPMDFQDLQARLEAGMEDYGQEPGPPRVELEQRERDGPCGHGLLLLPEAQQERDQRPSEAQQDRSQQEPAEAEALADLDERRGNGGQGAEDAALEELLGCPHGSQMLTDLAPELVPKGLLVNLAPVPDISGEGARPSGPLASLREPQGHMELVSEAAPEGLWPPQPLGDCAEEGGLACQERLSASGNPSSSSPSGGQQQQPSSQLLQADERLSDSSPSAACGVEHDHVILNRSPQQDRPPSSPPRGRQGPSQRLQQQSLQANDLLSDSLPSAAPDRPHDRRSPSRDQHRSGPEQAGRSALEPAPGAPAVPLSPAALSPIQGAQAPAQLGPPQPAPWPPGVPLSPRASPIPAFQGPPHFDPSALPQLPFNPALLNSLAWAHYGVLQGLAPQAAVPSVHEAFQRATNAIHVMPPVGVYPPTALPDSLQLASLQARMQASPAGTASPAALLGMHAPSLAAMYPVFPWPTGLEQQFESSEAPPSPGPVQRPQRAPTRSFPADAQARSAAAPKPALTAMYPVFPWPTGLEQQLESSEAPPGPASQRPVQRPQRAHARSFRADAPARSAAARNPERNPPLSQEGNMERRGTVGRAPVMLADGGRRGRGAWNALPEVPQEAPAQLDKAAEAVTKHNQMFDSLMQSMHHRPSSRRQVRLPAHLRFQEQRDADSPGRTPATQRQAAAAPGPLGDGLGWDHFLLDHTVPSPHRSRPHPMRASVDAPLPEGAGDPGLGPWGRGSLSFAPSRSPSPVHRGRGPAPDEPQGKRKRLSAAGGAPASGRKAPAALDEALRPPSRPEGRRQVKRPSWLVDSPSPPPAARSGPPQAPRGTLSQDGELSPSREGSAFREELPQLDDGGEGLEWATGPPTSTVGTAKELALGRAVGQHHTGKLKGMSRHATHPRHPPGYGEPSPHAACGAAVFPSKLAGRRSRRRAGWKRPVGRPRKVPHPTGRPRPVGAGRPGSATAMVQAPRDAQFGSGSSGRYADQPPLGEAGPRDWDAAVEGLERLASPAKRACSCQPDFAAEIPRKPRSKSVPPRSKSVPLGPGPSLPAGQLQGPPKAVPRPHPPGPREKASRINNVHMGQAPEAGGAPSRVQGRRRGRGRVRTAEMGALTFADVPISIEDLGSSEAVVRVSFDVQSASEGVVLVSMDAQGSPERPVSVSLRVEGRSEQTVRVLMAVQGGNDQLAGTVTAPPGWPSAARGGFPSLPKPGGDWASVGGSGRLPGAAPPPPRRAARVDPVLQGAVPCSEHSECLVRAKRLPGGDPMESAPFRRLIEMIRGNSREFAANGRVLRLKQYMIADAREPMINMVLDALMVNTRVEALYIQNFEQGMQDPQLDRLTEVLKLKRIWAVNVGENFHISLAAWERFCMALPETAVGYMYVSEHHLLRTNLKLQMRRAIRENRKRAPPPDPYVAAQVTNMWFNPLRKTSDGRKVSKSVKGCAIARASMLVKQALSRSLLTTGAPQPRTANGGLPRKLYQPVLQKRPLHPAARAGTKGPVPTVNTSKGGQLPSGQKLVRSKGKLAVSSRVQKLVRRERSPVRDQRPLARKKRAAPQTKPGLTINPGRQNKWYDKPRVVLRRTSKGESAARPACPELEAREVPCWVSLRLTTHPDSEQVSVSLVPEGPARRRLVPSGRIGPPPGYVTVKLSPERLPRLPPEPRVVLRLNILQRYVEPSPAAGTGAGAQRGASSAARPGLAQRDAVAVRMDTAGDRVSVSLSPIPQAGEHREGLSLQQEAGDAMEVDVDGEHPAVHPCSPSGHAAVPMCVDGGRAPPSATGPDHVHVRIDADGDRVALALVPPAAQQPHLGACQGGAGREPQRQPEEFVAVSLSLEEVPPPPPRLRLRLLVARERRKRNDAGKFLPAKGRKRQRDEPEHGVLVPLLVEGPLVPETHPTCSTLQPHRSSEPGSVSGISPPPVARGAEPGSGESRPGLPTATAEGGPEGPEDDDDEIWRGGVAVPVVLEPTAWDYHCDTLAARLWPLSEAGPGFFESEDLTGTYVPVISEEQAMSSARSGPPVASRRAPGGLGSGAAKASRVLGKRKRTAVPPLVLLGLRPSLKKQGPAAKGKASGPAAAGAARSHKQAASRPGKAHSVAAAERGSLLRDIKKSERDSVLNTAAARQSNEELRALVASGLLAPGNASFVVKRRTHPVTVRADGVLVYNGWLYLTLSTLAQVIFREHAMSSSNYWKNIIYRGQPLEVRRQALKAGPPYRVPAAKHVPRASHLPQPPPTAGKAPPARRGEAPPTKRQPPPSPRRSPEAALDGAHSPPLRERLDSPTAGPAPAGSPHEAVPVGPADRDPCTALEGGDCSRKRKREGPDTELPHLPRRESDPPAADSPASPAAALRLEHPGRTSVKRKRDALDAPGEGLGARAVRRRLSDPPIADLEEFAAQCAAAASAADSPCAPLGQPVELGGAALAPTLVLREAGGDGVVSLPPLRLEQMATG
eukprot:jgi/Botrbrau1/15646/Bobra.4_1s0030.1